MWIIFFIIQKDIATLYYPSSVNNLYISLPRTSAPYLLVHLEEVGLEALRPLPAGAP